MDVLLLNVAYLLMLAAFLVREIIWLRTLIVASQLCFIVYALLAKNPSMTGWNTVYIVINAVQVFRLLRERRPISLSAGLEAIYRQAFLPMTRREFLYFWRTGQKREVTDDYIVRGGTNQSDLIFVLEGAVSVIRDGEEVTRIHRGSFVAEPSILDEEPASIDARAVGTVSYISWDQETLVDLREVNPAVFIKVQEILGKYMTKKLRAALNQ